MNTDQERYAPMRVINARLISRRADRTQLLVTWELDNGFIGAIVWGLPRTCVLNTVYEGTGLAWRVLPENTAVSARMAQQLRDIETRLLNSRGSTPPAH